MEASNKKPVNVLGLDQADSDGDDLNNRSESTDPIEEFLRDIEAESCEDDDNGQSEEEKVANVAIHQQPDDGIPTQAVPLTNMRSRITEVSGDLLDDNSSDYGNF